MKITSTCLPLLLFVTTAHAGVFVHETAHEFTATADVNGDGISDVIIIDSGSGMYRIGYGTAADGALDWAAARPTGVTQLSAVAVGPVTGSAANIIVGSAGSNRVQMVSPTDIGYIEPRHVGWFRNPSGLAAMNLAWLGSDPGDELVVINTPAGGDAVFKQYDFQGANIELLDSDVMQGASPEQVNPVRHNRNSPPMLATMGRYEEQIEGGYETRASLLLYKPHGVESYEPSVALVFYGLTPSTRYVAGNFDADQTDVFFYTPGSQDISSYRILETNSVLSWGDATDYPTAHPVKQLVVLQSSSSARLAVLLDNGSVRLINFNGTTQTWATDALIQPAAATAVSSLVALGPNRFLALSGDGLEATTAEEWKRDGGGNWSSQGSTTLPKVNRSAVYPNVLLMGNHPFREENVWVHHSYRSRDWSDAASITSGSISAESSFFSSSGLGTPSAQTIGNTSDSGAVAVPNQLHSQISLFSLRKEIGPVVNVGTVYPPSGTYSRGFRPSYTGPGNFYFRINGEGGFTLADAGNPMPWIERNTIISYYVEHSGGGFSPVSAVEYQFTNPPAQIDSDGDGLPDFVENDRGTDPTKGDSDGDGFSDLEELTQGTDPLDANNKPTQRNSRTGMMVQAAATLLNLEGEIIDRAAENTPASIATLDGYELTNVGIGAEVGAPFLAFLKVSGVSSAEHFLTVRTAEHFTVRTGTPQDRRGREFLGLVPALEPVAWSFDADDEPDATAFLWGGTNWHWGSPNWRYANQEVSYFNDTWSEVQTSGSWGSDSDGQRADDWLIGYQNAVQNRTPLIQITLSPDTTLQALLVEEILHHLLRERDAFSAARHFSVSPGRRIESTVPQANVTLEEIAALERPDPAHPAARVVRPRMVLTHVDAAMSSPNVAMDKLIKIARDLYRLGQQPESGDSLQFGSPLDVLRQFIRTGALPAEYAAALSVPPAGRAEALAEIATLIQNVPTRTPQALNLRLPQISNIPFGMTAAEMLDGSTAYVLLDAQSRMLRLGQNRAPGTPVTITAYLDMPTIGGFQALEVITANFETLPSLVAEDSDGDLLADTWELLHFSTLAHAGLDKVVSSQYTLAQEYLEGTDPTDNSNNPLTAPIALELNKLEIRFNALGQPELKVEWPPQYDDFVEVVFQSSTDLKTFTTFGVASLNQPGVFKRSFSITGARRFFRPYVRLKR